MKRTYRTLIAMALCLSVVAACTEGDGEDATTADEEGAEAAPGDGEAQAGEPIEPLTLQFYASDFGPEFGDTSRILAEDWEQLGLTIELEPIEFNTFVSQISQGGQIEDIALGSVGGDPPNLDPNFWLDDLTSCDGANNGSLSCDEEFDEGVDESSRIMDEDERREAVFELQEEHHSWLPWWLISTDTNTLLYNSDRWGNVENSAPTSPGESMVRPWLTMEPLTDDLTLDWAGSEPLSTYNILVEGAANGYLRRIYDTLLRDDNGEIIEWAAESWETIDDTTIELTIRDDMTFHDGEPLTVEDAVFSYEYMLEHEPPAIAVGLGNVDSVEQVDDSVMRITMRETDASFPRISLAHVPILPQHIWEDVDNPLEYEPYDDDAVIGSGPFKLESWVRDQEHILSVHDDHFMAPDYDGIRLNPLGQADAIRAAMESGDADIANTVLPGAEQGRLAEQLDHLDIMEAPNHGGIMVWPNNEDEPTSDYAFRLALRTATNKDRIAEEAWLGYGTVADEGPIPPIMDVWHNPDLEPIEYDIEGAREVLEEAGYSWNDQGELLYPEE